MSVFAGVWHRKDRLKETLHDAFGAPSPDLAWSRRLGAAAMELIWAALAADSPLVHYL